MELTADGAAPRGGAPELKKGRWFAIAPGVRHAGLSIFDQAIVSGVNFLTTLIIGRLCGAEELGLYALGFTLVVLVTNLQSAVLTTPYTVFANRMTVSRRREYAGTVLLHCLLLALAVMGALFLWGAVGGLLQPDSHLPGVLRVLAVAMPLLLLREFVRRLALAHLQMGLVVGIDTVVAVVQVGGLLGLAVTDRLSVTSAYLVMAAACAIAGAAALLFMKSGFEVRTNRVAAEFRRSWSLGKWIVAGRMTVLFQTYAVHWMLALYMGAEATGIYAACLTVLLAANPFVIGIGNVLEPRAARAMADGGPSELRRVVGRATRLLGGVMGAYCGLVIIAGGWMVAWLYQGEQYAGQGPTVTVLALGALISAWQTGAAYGLRILERADISFRAGLLSLTLTLLLGILLVPAWGILGGASAVLAGDAAGAVVRWLAFLRYQNTESPSQNSVSSR